jgi:serine/threonine-protein kinase
MAMNAERMQRLAALFDAALALEPAARAAYLERECVDDAELRAEVERLLLADEAAADGAFIEGAVRAAARALTGEDRRTGLVLGPYRLLRELGRGGMGTVWLAERADDAYRARVAIKLVRGGFGRPDLERRFRAERQTLADLRHENIARLLDGGTAPDGTPFLVMEYVDGAPITEHARARALGVRDRLALFHAVCGAVQHAHAALVVHRDIKPSNVLVGQDGVPKLVDFGIAKPLGPDEGSDTTALVRPLTPSYASPEQIRGERVTVATDVYALGVLLYELLSGTQPFGGGESSLEVQRRVLEDEPRAPSDAVRGSEAGTGVPARDIAGDLDNIVRKALSKEPERRYASVEQLAEDVRRHLAGEPVQARPATARYRLSKFVRRHRAGVAVAAGLAVLLTGLGVYHVTRLTRERDVANRERQTAEQVSAFLVDLFSAADPRVALGDTITARALLDRGRERLDTALTGAPLVRARMLETLGSVYGSLGRYADARDLHAAAAQLIERADGPLSPRLAATLLLLADDRGSLAERDGAIADARRAVAILETTRNDSALAAGLRGLASAFLDAALPDSASPLLDRALALQEAALGPEHLAVAATLDLAGNALAQRGEYEGALAAQRRALVIRDAHVGERDLTRANNIMNIGSTLQNMGRPDSARALYERTLPGLVAAYGTGHPTINAMRRNLVGARLAMGEVDGALAEMRQLLEADRLALGADHPMLGNHWGGIGSLLRQQRDRVAAVAAFDSSIAVFTRALRPDAIELWSPLYNKSNTLNELGHDEEALALARHALEVAEAHGPATHPRIGSTLHTIGHTLEKMGRLEEAEGALNRAVSVLEAAYGHDHLEVTRPLRTLGRLYIRQGRFDAAVAAYARTLPILEKTVREPTLVPVLEDYARALRGAGDEAAAATMEERARAIRAAYTS